jgi:hypothetical protein
MKNRKTWIITGTVGILAVGTGAAFASQPSTPGDVDPAHTTDTVSTQAPKASADDGATHGVTLTPDPQATKAATPALTHVDPAQAQADSAITSITLVSAPSPASALSTVSAPSPVSALSPLSAPSAPSAD